MLIRFFLSVFFSSKNFCERSERWPPLSEMKLFMGEAGKSCVEVCKMSGELNNVYCNTIYTSSETQGQIVGARESLNGRENMARRKVKNGEKSPWGQCLTRPVPNCRDRSGFWLVWGWRKKKRAGGENSKRMGSARNRESNVTIGNILAFELKG